MQLSKKHKKFLNFLLNFWNKDQIWNISKKNMALMAHVFQRLDSAKDMKMPKNPSISEHPSTVNMLMGPKYCWNLHGRPFIIFFNLSDINWLWNLSPSDIWNLRTISEHIDCRWQLLSSEELNFTTFNPNAII